MANDLIQFGESQQTMSSLEIDEQFGDCQTDWKGSCTCYA